MRLKLNSYKTKYIQFGSRQQIKKIDTSPIKANGKLIPKSYNMWYLGGYLESGHQPNIQWTCETKSEGCSGKLYKNLIYQETHIGKYMHNLGLNALHIAHRLWKCNAIWNHKKVLNKYQNLYNMYTKLVLWKSKYNSTSQTLQHLQQLLVQEMIHHKVLTLSHKCIYGQALEYLKNLIEIRGKHDRNMCSNENDLLIRSPYIKHQTFASCSFKYAAPALWNGLLLHLREIKDLTTFKHQLKTHLYRKVFPT